MLLLVARKRPLSTIAATCSVAVAIFEVVQILKGNLYQRVLNYPDGTTLLMVCCLMVVGLVALRQCSDLQALAFTWVTALSCVFAYEAVFKWSFYLTPFLRTMPPPELREFILELAVAATLLTGFAQHYLSGRDWTWIWLTAFCALWTFWLLVGFPQLNGQVVHPQILSWNLARDYVYLINRASKLTLFVTYYSLLPPRPTHPQEGVRVGSGPPRS